MDWESNRARVKWIARGADSRWGEADNEEEKDPDQETEVKVAEENEAVERAHAKPLGRESAQRTAYE